jgi:hypothetical protein
LEYRAIIARSEKKTTLFFAKAHDLHSFHSFSPFFHPFSEKMLEKSPEETLTAAPLAWYDTHGFQVSSPESAARAAPF